MSLTFTFMRLYFLKHSEKVSKMKDPVEQDLNKYHKDEVERDAAFHNAADSLYAEYIKDSGTVSEAFSEASEDELVRLAVFADTCDYESAGALASSIIKDYILSQSLDGASRGMG